jgi:Squalene-hopene cyclase C-terminal domain
MDADAGHLAPPILRVDPVPTLMASANPAIAFFARRDLGGRADDATSALWDLPGARRIVRRQQEDGSWRYPGGKPSVRNRRGYDQIEAFRQLSILVEMFGFTREHDATARAAEFLFSCQADDGDFRGVYGNQYATTYVGAITEVLIKAGYVTDTRVSRALDWLLAMRQQDGGWAVPVRTVGIPWPEMIDVDRHPQPLAPDRTAPFSHLVTGMALRAFAAHPAWVSRIEILDAGALLASRLHKRDCYGDRGAAAYWERVSFPFWFTDLVSALDTLSRLGLSPQDPPIARALIRLRDRQHADGTFTFKLLRARDPDLPWWICLAVCRSVSRWRHRDC